MKSLPKEYWENGFGGLPTYHQRWWLQRCLELLDSDTSFWLALPVVNSAGLIRELISLPPRRPGTNRPNARTLRYLFEELQVRVERDVVLPLYVADTMREHWANLVDLVREGVERGRALSRKSEGRYIEWAQSQGLVQAEGHNILNRFDASLSHDRLAWLDAHQVLLGTMLHPASRPPIEDALDVVTTSWLWELLVSQGHSAAHLSERLRKTFLPRRVPAGREPANEFAARLHRFFGTLTSTLRPMDVYLRLQARKEFRTLGHIGPVVFTEKCLDTLQEIGSLLRAGQIQERDAEAINRFLFKEEASRHLIFAVIRVQAHSVSAASNRALKALDDALSQARVEFERSQFSIDNAIYVKDVREGRFEAFTRRKAVAEAYTSRGNPLQLERILNQLDQLRYSPRAKPNRASIDQVTQLALQWHRYGVEAAPDEIRFMNHWIELEQLLKHLRVSELSQEGGAGDLVVRALATALADEGLNAQLSELWLDCRRCGLLGPDPYRTPYGGEVQYSAAYLSGASLASGGRPYQGRQTFAVRLLGGESRPVKTYHLPVGFQVYPSHGERVGAGEWLAGATLSSTRRSSVLLDLYKNRPPSCLGTLYLVRHWRSIVEDSLAGENSQAAPVMYAQIAALKPRDVAVYDAAWRLVFEIRRLPRPSGESSRWPCANPGELAGNLAAIDSGLAKAGWLSNVGLRARLASTGTRLKHLGGATMQALDALDQLAEVLARSKTLPTDVWRELHREQEPDYLAWRALVIKEPERLILELPDQPLLHSRVRSLSRTLAAEQADHQMRYAQYTRLADRLRRSRNSLVHSAAAPPNLPILARALYQCSKFYVTHVVRNLARAGSSQASASDFYLRSISSPSGPGQLGQTDKVVQAES